TSTALRTDSRASSHQDDDGESEETSIDRRRLDPDTARTHFLPSRVNARDVDFSDRIDGTRKSYYTSRSRRRGGGEDVVEYISSEDEDEDLTPEGLNRRIARLQREAEEVKSKITRYKSERNAGRPEKNGAQRSVDEEALKTLSMALSSLNTGENGSDDHAQSRLAERLNITAPPPIESHTTDAVAQEDPDSATRTSTAQIGSLETRLTLLEFVLGLSSIPLPTQNQNHPNPTIAAPKPILPTLAALDRQLSVLASTTPASIEAISQRVHQLRLDADKLEEARLKAKYSHEALMETREHGLASPTAIHNRPQRSSITLPEGTDTRRIDEVVRKELEDLEDPIQISKINALFGTLGTIESLAPLLPPLLDRLRSLRTVHADAANAVQNLGDLEKRQVEMGEEIQRWREGLKVVEQRMKEGEERMKGNMGVVEGWVGELEGRVKDLGD
ncbi:hypothetical protein MMC25_000231, partial [Agyrium rufum]|nr:hypothetical protein [Agyrium rufum]